MPARIEAVVHRVHGLGECVLRPLVVVLPVLLLGISMLAGAETSDSAWITGICDAADHDELVRNLLGASVLTSSARGSMDRFRIVVGVVGTLVTAPADAIVASALPPRSPPRV